MTNIRRYFREGNIYSLMHVTHNRMPILVDHIDLLWAAFQRVGRNPCGFDNAPFDLIAWAILPDHLHILIDPKQCDLSNLMRQVKLSFSTRYRKRMGMRQGRVWQYRYWDHVIRDQDDLNRHLDYIHYNPVKHGLASAAISYPHSSFEVFCDAGFYSNDWGVVGEPPVPDGFEE